MDGVTDTAFRYMVCKHGKPSLTITEFTNVEGLARGAVKMLTAFLYNEIERPVVGQIYGVEVESYYKAAVMLCALGFDGIDINMGCPATKVAARGSGAGLIKTPELAKQLIRTTKKAAKDWSEGITMEKAGVHPDIIAEVEKINAENGRDFDKLDRKLIPVSVKTRIGYESVVVNEWIKTLLEELPANISLHGRTLKQLYMGKADWNTIGEAAEIVKDFFGNDEKRTSLIGNGDVSSIEDAHEKINQYGVDGVLIGRATFGNPWLFSGHEPSVNERLNAVLEHLKYFKELGHLNFHNIKKHLAWYCKGFEGVKEVRMKLMMCHGFDEAEAIIKELLSKI